MKWTQAAFDQKAHREAVADVSQEAQGYQRLATDPAGEVG